MASPWAVCLGDSAFDVPLGSHRSSSLVREDILLWHGVSSSKKNPFCSFAVHAVHPTDEFGTAWLRYISTAVIFPWGTIALTPWRMRPSTVPIVTLCLCEASHVGDKERTLAF